MLKTKGLALTIIFIIAFSIRLWFIFEYSSPPEADELSYDSLAVSVLEGKGYVNDAGQPTAMRPPGYPLFLSVIYFFFGRNYFFVRLCQVLINSLLCILIYYLGSKMFGEKVGILAGCFASVHLGFIAQQARILTESLSTFFLFIAIIFFYKARQNYRKKIYYILTGFILGTASLIRANLLIVFFLVAFVFIYDLYKKASNFKESVRYLVIYTIAFLIPILPWTVRNYRIFHAFVPISTKQGMAFYSSYTPLNGKIYGLNANDDITQKASMLSSEADQSKFLTKETLKLIKNNPSIFFKLLGLKMAYLFSPFDWELMQDRVIYNYLYTFFFPFFIIGSFMLIHRFNNSLPLYLPILSTIATAAIFYGSPRFRILAEPYMILLSSAAIIYICERIQYKKIFISFLSIFLLGNFFLFLYSSHIKQICKMLLEHIGLW